MPAQQWQLAHERALRCGLPAAAPAEEAETGGNLLEEAEAELAKGDVNQAAAKFSQALEKDKECTHLVYAGLGKDSLVPLSIYSDTSCSGSSNTRAT